jgi:transcriptional regulator with XRE-family HTH domain
MEKTQEQFFKKFGNIVRKIRLKKKMTLEDMLEYGFSPQHFQKIETGQKAVSLFTMHRIAKSFGMKSSALISKME